MSKEDSATASLVVSYGSVLLEVIIRVALGPNSNGLTELSIEPDDGGGEVMDWSEAKTKISAALTQGTDLNTTRSKLRRIISLNHRCNKYNYAGEEGFQVRISRYDSNHLDIPWSMLENCFHALQDPGGYNGRVFKEKYLNKQMTIRATFMLLA